MILYHGSKATFSTVDPSTFGKGTDQLGSGFYLSNSLDVAMGYAGDDGYVLEFDCDLGKPIPSKGSLTRPQIRKLLTSAPDYNDTLTNFGDVEYEGFDAVLNRAIDVYFAAGGKPLNQLNTISNDFYRGKEAAFLRGVVKVCGWNSTSETFDNGVIHYVVFEPHQCTFVNSTTTMDLKSDYAPLSPML